MIDKNEVFATNDPTKYCNQCKDCIYRAQINVNDKTVNGWYKANCAKFKQPGNKSLYIINNEKDCQFYTKEN